MLITDEFDGVRTFHVPTTRPTLHATLMFRVGMVDETLPTSGWLHLLEHLALHDRESPTLAVQGTTGLLTTTFQFDGPPSEVADALHRLTAWLAEPDLSRAAHESGVLQAEARLRRGGAASRALGERYGAQGPGLVGYEEPGLARARRPGSAPSAPRRSRAETPRSPSSAPLRRACGFTCPPGRCALSPTPWRPPTGGRRPTAPRRAASRSAA